MQQGVGERFKEIWPTPLGLPFYFGGNTMETTFYAIIRKQCNSLVVTIPKENVGMMNLKEKETRKFTIEDGK